jgi:hypothetical protein
MGSCADHGPCVCCVFLRASPAQNCAGAVPAISLFRPPVYSPASPADYDQRASLLLVVQPAVQAGHGRCWWRRSDCVQHQWRSALNSTRCGRPVFLGVTGGAVVHTPALLTGLHTHPCVPPQSSMLGHFCICKIGDASCSPAQPIIITSSQAPTIITHLALSVQTPSDTQFAQILLTHTRFCTTCRCLWRFKGCRPCCIASLDSLLSSSITCLAEWQRPSCAWGPEGHECVCLCLSLSGLQGDLPANSLQSLC